MEAESRSRSGKRKAAEQRGNEKESYTSLPSSSAPAATTSTTSATPIDERDETPHSDNAPRRGPRRGEGTAASSHSSPPSRQGARERKQRSQTGDFSSPQDKGKQRNMEDQGEQIPSLLSSPQPSSRRRRLGGRSIRGRRSSPLPSSSIIEAPLSSQRESSGLSRRTVSTAMSSTTPPSQSTVTASSPPLPPLSRRFGDTFASQSRPRAAGPSSTTMADQSLRKTSGQPRESVRPPTSQGGADKEYRRYLLHVLQQPKTGCAFGSILLSRLALAPPLIVQLQAIDRAGREISLEPDLPFLVCRVQLADGDGRPIDMLTATASTTLTTSAPASNSPPPSALPAPSTSAASASPTSVRLLYGTLVASPMQLYTQDNRPAIIFVFPEISIRSRGRFQLDISLIRLPFPSVSSTSTSTLATASTEPFDVVLSANYVAPEVTDITRHFARQGVGLLLPPDQAQSGPTAD